jgi:hypothetical protein
MGAEPAWSREANEQFSLGRSVHDAAVAIAEQQAAAKGEWFESDHARSRVLEDRREHGTLDKRTQGIY